jgi:hypothetical protein
MGRTKQPSRTRRPSRLAAAVLWFLQEFTYRGRTVVVAVFLLVTLSAAGTIAWRKWSPAIAGQEKYVVTADRITLSPPPAWLEKDIAAEALEDAGLAGELSLLDTELVPRLIEALELHPWIGRVARAEKQYPARIDVEVEYRVPLAAIEAAPGQPFELCPVDEHAVRLPAADLPRVMLFRLPRIAEAGQLPLVGQPIEGARVAGALAIIQFLESEWNELHLVSIASEERPEIRGEQKYHLYHLIARGGTRIHWGAAPDAAAPDEPPPETKLARLQDFIARNSDSCRLDTTRSPQVIDVRHGLSVTPRVAARESSPTE